MTLKLLPPRSGDYFSTSQLAQYASSKPRSQKAELSQLVCSTFIGKSSQHQQN